MPLVAEIDGKVVGLASGLIRNSDPKTAHVYQMWVSPAARGKGIASSFLIEIRTWALDKECASMELAVTTNNQSAVGLYLSYGFCPEGDVKELRAGSELITQSMVLELRYVA